MANVKRIYVEKKEDYAVAAKELKQEVKEFARILSSGRYLVETHEAMAHLLLNNLSPNLNVVKSRKFPALSNRKADSEFKLV